MKIKLANPDETLEIAGDIRDLALQQMASGLFALGVAQSDIDQAIIEAKAQNSDAPLLALAKARF